MARRGPARSHEEKQRWLRERMRQREWEEAREARARRPLSPEALDRRERQRELPQYLRVEEVAAILGVSGKSVYRWLRDRATMVGGGRRRTMLISRRVLDEWLAEHAPTSRSA